MMKLRYSPSDSITFEAEVGTAKAAFEAIAELQEVFEGHDICGCCQSRDVRFEVREFGGNSYYKMLCMSCRATLDFGQHREGGGLFPKVWDKENRCPLPTGGWSIYQPDQQQREGDQRQQHHEQRQADPTQRWLDFFKADPPLSEFNEFCERYWPEVPEVQQRHMKQKIADHAKRAGWVWSNSERCYVRGGP